MIDSQIDLLDELDILRWKSYVSSFCQNSNQSIGQTFFDLARYASFPILLSSDLLYKIYLNFIASQNKTDTTLQIWEASEFLFSPIIKELGYDLYEIHPEIRQSLKNKLKYPEKIRIAFFMKEYAEKCRHNFQSDQIEKAQILNYEIELDPSKAVTEVLKIISEAKGKPIGNYASYLLEYGKSKLGAKGNSALKSQIKSTEALLKGINNQNSNTIAKALKGFDIGAATDGIKISIPTDVKIPKEFEISTKRKLRALVIAVGNGHFNENSAVNSAELFAKKLEKLASNDEYNIKEIIGQKTTKENIIIELNQIAKNTNIKDDLVLYFAANALNINGFCEIACYNSSSKDQIDNKFIYLSDTEIGELFKNLDCASITIILQVDFAASPYWLKNVPNFKSKTTIFACCKFDQKPAFINQKIAEKEVCVFTYFLVESMTLSKNNRNIFADALQKMTEYYFGKEKLLETKTPVLIGSPETYNLNFIKGADEDYLLKNQLFKSGIANKTAYELSSSSKEFEILKKSHLKNNEQAQVLANKIKEINNLNSELPPIFLLIYSDHTQKLEHLKKEKTEILKLLAPLNVVVLLLENPDTEALSNLMKSPKYRNRIHLIYYDGYDDDNGNMFLNKKSFFINEFADLLNYQDNLKLFFSNIFRSNQYAEYLTQMGVKYSYGIKGSDSNQIVFAIGVEFFKKLIQGESINNLIDFQNYSSNTR